MTSQRKIQANRLNAHKASGPRTSEGKKAASHNSRKHGLASMDWRQPESSAEIERLVRAFCGDNQDNALLTQARVVAENELALRAVRKQKLATIERLRDPAAVPFVQRQKQPRQQNEQQQHDEYEAMERAAADLTRLERYERRAWSRQKRALREFVDIQHRQRPTNTTGL